MKNVKRERESSIVNEVTGGNFKPFHFFLRKDFMCIKRIKRIKGTKRIKSIKIIRSTKE